MVDFYRLFRPILRALPPETARLLTLAALAAGFGGRAATADPPILAQRLWGLAFPNPIGMAAGFDKDVRVAGRVARRCGFGFVEIGTVTPRPQPGNPKPRVFRLDDDRATDQPAGVQQRGPRSSRRAAGGAPRRGIVGVNIGRNRDSADAGADYVEGVRRTPALADYLVVNVSSPNTPGLRELQRARFSTTCFGSCSRRAPGPATVGRCW